MGAFRAIIGCNMEQFTTGSTEPNRYLILDLQQEKTVNSSSTLASQPLQTGDTMTDHMYNNPDTVSLSGSFSLNGKNWNDDSYNFLETGDRLTNIQTVFEKIKAEGILCRIVTIDEEDLGIGANGITLKSNAKNRFKIRNNMALNRINWTEKQNSLNFRFDFTEIIMVEKQEYEELSDEEKEKYGYPSVTSPAGSSLGTILAETGQLSQVVLKSLYDNGYIPNDFLRGLCESFYLTTVPFLLANAVITLGLTVAAITAVPAAIAVAAAAATGGSIAGALAGSVSAIFPVGTIVVSVAAVIAGIAIGIVSFVKYIKKKQKQKIAFKLINGSAEQDGARLINLLDDIEREVNQVKSNLTIYNIYGNKEQIVTLNLAGRYYYLNFKKDTAKPSGDWEWSCDVMDMNNEALKTVQHKWCPVAAFTNLNRNQNLWFKDLTKEYEAYLVNPSLSEEIQKDDGDLKEKIKNVRQELESYTIWVSKGPIGQNIKKVTDAIENAIESRGFVE